MERVPTLEDRKRAEEVLVESETSVRLIVNSIPGLVATMTPEGEVEFVNNQALEYFGKTLEELKGWAIGDAVHPDDLPHVVSAWRHSVETGDPYDVDHRLRRADGAFRWFHIRGRPLRDAEGRIVRWYNLLTDIDERRRAEEKLRRSEAYLFEAQKLSHTGSFGWNVSSGEIYWSPETLRIFEYEQTTKITVDLALQRTHPEDRPAVEQLIERVSRERTEFDFEQRLPMPDGSVKYLHIMGRPSGEESSRLEFVGAVTDVTAAKQTERTLRRSEECLLEAQTLSQTGSWRHDVASGTVAVSPEIYRLFGLKPGEDASSPDVFFSRLHLEDRERVRKLFEKSEIQKTDYESDYRIVLPDGAIKHLHSIGHPVLNESGDLIEFAGTSMDVTAAKQAEEKIRQSERELRPILDLTPQFIVEFGPEGSPLYVNQAALDYHGLSLDEWRTADLNRLLHPQDAERMRREHPGKFRSGVPYEIEVRLRRRDGQYRWFFFRFKPMLDKQGRLTRWYAAATDIEDRKQAEQRLHNENVALREEVDKASMFEEIVGTSPPLKTVLSRISKVAPTDSSILITGETGTGKELIARAIHKRSKRSGRAFVSVNCAALAPSLISSELFGHERGAFTGATQRRLGRFELADGGTIFLDEVGELPADTQVALLRVLQEREFERVGGTHPIRVDVRVIAATNRDFKAATVSGTFRLDLYYRLNVFLIEVPSLRERREDILMLLEYFVKRYSNKIGKTFRRIDKRTLELFLAYDWPSNIRELQNVIERSVILCSGDVFSVDEAWLSKEAPDEQPSPPQSLPFTASLADKERQMIEAALAECGARISGPSGAAAKLGIPPSTLDRKIKALNIRKNRFRHE